MRRLIRMLTVNALMCLAMACSAVAQTAPETPTKLPEHAKIVIAQVHVPIALTSESNAVDLEEDSISMLSMVSDMLNEGVTEKAKNNFESIRREAMLNAEETLSSQFLSVNSVKQSV